jgi:uncharacterized protein YndB with AHSA1/START domain
MVHLIGWLVLVLCGSVPEAPMEDHREVFEIELEAGVDEVWKAFTTTSGLQSWVAPLAEIDFRVGGKWRANYNPEGKLGDETTIENTILSFDPKRMISLKATGFPRDFAFREVAGEMWTVIYFVPLSETKTRITLVGLGYNETEQSQRMRAFFATGNRISMQQLATALEKQRQPR